MTPRPAAPPPLPPEGPGKRKMPGWVWGMTIGGALSTLALGVGTYSMFQWANNFTKRAFEGANPEFEYLRLAGDGKVEVRHRATGREFVTPGFGQIAIRPLATADVDPPPEWTAMPNAKKNARGVWEVADAEEDLSEALERSLTERNYRIERMRDDVNITGCDPKTLQCVTYRVGSREGGGSWYSVRAMAVK